ncbi:DUF1566 domain-containing protein [Spirochaetota bacterium]
MKRVSFLLVLTVMLFIVIIVYGTTHFTDNGNGTIKDNLTGLTWTKCSMKTISSSPVMDATTNCVDTHSEVGNWVEAILACENLNYAGKTDWRLPNIKELISIVDWKRINPAIDSKYFPRTENSYYWSSTNKVGSHFNASAWCLNFTNGDFEGRGKTALTTSFVRCVAGP